MILGRTLAPTTRIAVGDAGAIPYFSRLPALDFLGLNNRYLARHPSAVFPGGIDVDHVLAESPDLLIVVSAGAAGFPEPKWNAGIRRVSLDILSRSPAARYRELGRREFSLAPVPPSKDAYQVVVLARDDVPLPEDFLHDLRAWAAPHP